MIIAVTEIVDMSHPLWLKYLKRCGRCIPRGYIPVGEDGVLNDVTRITGLEVGAGTAVESFCRRPWTWKDSLASDDDDEDNEENGKTTTTATT